MLNIVRPFNPTRTPETIKIAAFGPGDRNVFNFTALFPIDPTFCLFVLIQHTDIMQLLTVSLVQQT